MAQRLILATRNAGKLKELRQLLASWPLELVEAGSLQPEAPEEDADTFEGNALLKARAASRCDPQALALGDDGGLVVPSLGGIPGVHSSRWVSAQGGWSQARELLCERAGLVAEPDRRVDAHLVCALALVAPDGSSSSSQARIEGQLSWPPQAGHEGYGPGFLPIFTPALDTIWIDEVLVHRRSAFEALAPRLRSML